MRLSIIASKKIEKIVAGIDGSDTDRQGKEQELNAL